MLSPRHTALALVTAAATLVAAAGPASATNSMTPQRHFTGSGTLSMIEAEGPNDTDRYVVLRDDDVVPVTTQPGMAASIGHDVTMEDGELTSVDDAPEQLPAQVKVLMVQVRYDGSSAAAFAATSMASSATKTKNFYGLLSAGRTSMTVDVVPTMVQSAVAFDPADCKSHALGYDAEEGAREQGFDPDFYDRIVVVEHGSSGCTMAGFAPFYGRFAYLLDTNLHGSVVHELGHTFGAWHARGLSCTDSGTPVPISGTCVSSSTGGNSIEYGDPFDRMGGLESRATSTALFSTWHRATMGVLGPEQTVTVTQSATVTIDAADTAGKTLLMVPRIVGGKTTGQYFAVEKRRDVAPFETFASTDPFSTGVIVRLVKSATEGGNSDLVDMHPETPTFLDAPLTAGNTFRDPASGIEITASAVADAAATVTIAVPDTSPPTTPAGLSGRRLTAGSVALAWSAATDDRGTVSYEIRRDGTALTRTDQTSVTLGDDGLSHTFTVVATDAAGNRSTESAATTVSAYQAPAVPRATTTPQVTATPKVTATSDLLAPTIALVRGRLNRSRTFAVRIADRGGIAHMTIRVGAKSTQRSSLVLSRAQARYSTVTVTAIDWSGNKRVVRYRISRGRITAIV